MAVDLDDLLARAGAVLAELADVDPFELENAEVEQIMAAAPKLRGQLELAEARALERWKVRGLWRPSVAKSAAARLASIQRIPIQVARQRLRHGRALRTYPAIADAWQAGEIDR